MMHTKRLLATLLAVSLTLTGFPLQAQAALVTTEEVATTETVALQRAQVNQFLAREDVRRALVEQGVSEQAVQARVQAMTDAEIAELAGRVEHAPAGGNVLGLLFTVFIVLLVTDILGLTKVFPFTRPVR